MTCHRHLSALNIVPDAILVTTGRKPPIALFVESRVPYLQQLLDTPHKLAK
jgi:hypothetical protein